MIVSLKPSSVAVSLALLTLVGCSTPKLISRSQKPELTIEVIQEELNRRELKVDTAVQENRLQQSQQEKALADLTKEIVSLKGSVSAMNKKIVTLQSSDAKKATEFVPKPVPVLPNNQTADGKIIIGEAEWVWLDAANDVFQARVDTGATTSSISAQDVTVFERNGKNWVKFALSHKKMANPLEMEAPLVRYVQIRQASADKLDQRPVIRLTLRLGNLTEKVEFTLKDRSDMTFPVLLGREFLRDVAVVDVSREYIQPKPVALKEANQ